MQNQLSLPKSVELQNEQPNLDVNCLQNRNQEIASVTAALQNPESTLEAKREGWLKLAQLIPSGRSQPLSPFVVQKDLAQTTYLTQDQFNNRQDKTAFELKALGMSPENNRIYVVDNYYKAIAVNGVITSHGDLTSAVIDQVTKGQAQIIKMPWTNSDTGFGNEISLEKTIKNIMTTECQRQGKTPQTVDLRNVTVNLSVSSRDENNVLGIVTAINQLTSRGASVVIGAGNEEFNAIRKGVKGALFADGAIDRIGYPANKKPIPSSMYNNLGTALGMNTRNPKSFDPTTHSVIAPSVVKTRLAANGDLEIVNSRSPAGWSKFLAAENTKPISTVIQYQGPLHGASIQKPTTANDLKDYINWAQAKRKDVNLQGKENEPFVQLALKNEYKNRFGTNPLISASELDRMNFPMFESVGTLIQARVPNGRDPKDVLFSLDELVSGDIKNLTPYVESKGKLQTVLSDIELTTGTSFATPYAAGYEAVRKQEQINRGNKDK
jgi:hypothetical protein